MGLGATRLRTNEIPGIARWEGARWSDGQMLRFIEDVLTWFKHLARLTRFKHIAIFNVVVNVVDAVVVGVVIAIILVVVVVVVVVGGVVAIVVVGCWLLVVGCGCCRCRCRCCCCCRFT